MEEVELLSHLTHLALALRQAGLVDTELVRDLGAGLASKNRLCMVGGGVSIKE